MSKLMNIQRVAATALALGVLLGCGGGGGGSGTDGKKQSTDPGPSYVLNSGIYLDTTNRLALALMPEENSSGIRTWYGLRTVLSADPTVENPLPVLYRGNLNATTLTGTSSSVAGSAGVNTGTASLTAVNSTQLTGRLTITNTDSPPRDIAADQVRALTAAELAVAWSGTWTINGASALSENVTLSVPISAANVAVSNFLNCTVTVNSLASQSGADGVYNIGLTFSSASGVICPITGTRTGVLMAYASGSSKYLRLLAFDSASGQNVSFRSVLPG